MADILIKTENNNKVVEIKNENVPASEINYTNTQSSLQANNVQDAIDEVSENVGDLGNVIGMRGWNQLCDTYLSTQTISGVTFTNNGDGTITVNGTASTDISQNLNNNPINIINGHRYLLKGCPIGGSGQTYDLRINSFYNPGALIEYGNGVIELSNRNNNLSIQFVIRSGITVNNLIIKPQLIDLTALFGAGNEPITVKKFRVLFPANYYPYHVISETKLISDFTNYTITTGQETFNSLSRNGNIVTLNLDGRTNQTSTEVQVYQLPQGYRPLQNFRKALSIYSNTAQYAYITIGTGGEVKIYSGTSVRIMESITFVAQ